MKSNVVFIPTSYRPDYIKTVELERIQEKLTWARTELAYEYRDLPKEQREIQFSTYHWGMRNAWQIFVGGKERQLVS